MRQNRDTLERRISIRKRLWKYMIRNGKNPRLTNVWLFLYIIWLRRYFQDKSIWMKTVGTLETEDISKKKICDNSESLHCGGNAHSFNKRIESHFSNIWLPSLYVTYINCGPSSRKKKTNELWHPDVVNEKKDANFDKWYGIQND